MPSALMNAAWTAAQRHGCAIAAWCEKTVLAASAPISPWCTSTYRNASRYGNHCSYVASSVTITKKWKCASIRPSHRCTSTRGGGQQREADGGRAAVRATAPCGRRARRTRRSGSSATAASPSDLPATSANSSSAGTCAHAIAVIARWRLSQFSRRQRLAAREAVAPGGDGRHGGHKQRYRPLYAATLTKSASERRERGSRSDRRLPMTPGHHADCEPPADPLPRLRPQQPVASAIFIALTEQGHDVKVEVVSQGHEMEAAVAAHQPELIVCPFLKAFIPESIWKNHRCLVVHPGPQGDRGPSSLDWAVELGMDEWGITLLEADEEADAGDIWATRKFRTRDVGKSSLYRHEVRRGAVQAVAEAMNNYGREGYTPTPLDYNDPNVTGRAAPADEAGRPRDRLGLGQHRPRRAQDPRRRGPPGRARHDRGRRLLPVRRALRARPARPPGRRSSPPATARSAARPSTAPSGSRTRRRATPSSCPRPARSSSRA